MGKVEPSRIQRASSRTSPAHLSSRLTARIVQWDSKKGYGFLLHDKVRIFLHRRDFSEYFKQPELGDRIGFTLGQDDKGRSCAQNAVHISRIAGISVRSMPVLLCLLFLPGLMALTNLDLTKLNQTLVLTTLYLFLINGLTYLAYYRDKQAARTDAPRTRELKLHLLELFGGWPAAFIAQRRFNHKRTKASYKVVFWVIVFCHQYFALDFLMNWELSRSLLDWQRYLTGIAWSYFQSFLK